VSGADAADAGRPAVSVLVPAYNSARTIGRCMAALARQETRTRFEVIVVHSGEDETGALARQALPDVRVVQLAERAVAARARNVGAGLARGAILAFIDSDAYAAPDWIDRVVEAGTAGYELVCGAIENANPASPVSRAEQLMMFNEFLPGARQRPSWFALSGNMVLGRTAYDRFGPFPEVRAAEDIVFSRRLLAAGGRILFCPALRVAHDNRTELRAFLRNQVLVGRHTAMARRLVRFADLRSYWPFVLLLPVFPAAKLAKVVVHVARGRPRALPAVVRDFPLLLLGVCAYSLGMALGVAVRPAPGARLAATAPASAP
jgi:cellulose synthase/poly-beta-1,6-N-acetylglucosamine synthase-like glycosyltransferase